MAQALVRRLLIAIPILFGMSLVVFVILRLVPGDPARAVLGLNATPELIAQMHRTFHLDDPIYVQYLAWIGGLVRGDFCVDYRSDQPIAQLLVQDLPVTLELVIVAMLMSIIIAIPLGALAAVRQGHVVDKVTQGLGLVGISMPDFWIGITLILLFSLSFQWFPSSGFVPFTQDPLQNLKDVFLPSLSLAVGLAAVLVRITRAAMLTVLEQDFIRSTRARGIREGSVIVRHVLRNAAIPIVTVIGMQAGYLVGGTIVVEQVFALPGIGNLLLNATLSRNYPIVQAAVLVLGISFVVTNLVADLMYIVLNPRLRTASE
ncbi:MAG: binding-protein-dependent transport system inner rane component [Chloroflexi bacterium]|nr:binding-protein-dependent transport system inner rane component [Chloroflexota bacterium]